MSTKKHVSWDGHKYQGYADPGNGADDDSLPMANDALVFMVVSLNTSWKVSCGYFFIDGLSGKECANLVKVCIQRLHDIGIRVTSLTCDGPSCHLSMLKELGLTIDLCNLVTYFIHPQDTKLNKISKTCLTKLSMICLLSVHLVYFHRNILYLEASTCKVVKYKQFDY